MSAHIPEPEVVRRLVEKSLALPQLSERREEVKKLLEDYGRGLASERRALVVALVGATGAGKSTLLNALVGHAVATAGEERPTTAHAVVYAPDDAALGPLASAGARVVRYPRGAPGPWSGQVFVDTPDVNSVAAEHRDRARSVVDEADVAVVVLHKGSVAEAVQTDFLAPFARRRRLVFVLNHADLLSDEARRTLKEQVRAIAQERLGVGDAEVYAISALHWISGRRDAGEREELLRALQALGDAAVAERIRRSNAFGALRELATRVAPALEAADQAADRRAKLLQEGLGRARVMLGDDFTARLEAASVHLGHAVRREAARRLWGPAGWWMRLTLAGTSGVGAAALLVRGNPLLAGGVALGSALASRLQEYTLEKSAERKMSPETLADEVTAAAARTAVAGARTDAAQEGSEAQALSLPSPEALGEAFSRARAAAWEETAHLLLAEAVRRWWKIARFVLVPLVNLPLLALFGHVAYKVVRGYLEGPYVGADFLLNALALASLIAFAGAGLASLSLYGVRRRLVSTGRSRFEAALANVSAEFVNAVRQGQAPERAAARRFVELTAQ